MAPDSDTSFRPEHKQRDKEGNPLPRKDQRFTGSRIEDCYAHANERALRRMGPQSPTWPHRVKGSSQTATIAWRGRALMLPHMHGRGRDMTYTVELPDRTKQESGVWTGCLQAPKRHLSPEHPLGAITSAIKLDFGSSNLNMQTRCAHIATFGVRLMLAAAIASAYGIALFIRSVSPSTRSAGASLTLILDKGKTSGRPGWGLAERNSALGLRWPIALEA
jgi:hypothetical protein